MARRSWPEWWTWELELTPHVLRRMVDRGFSELDLRAMLLGASSYRRDVVSGRWRVMARHQGTQWEIIVEPDRALELLVVITAYRTRA